ncbi:MAG: pyridoxal phosphate-dependent aminotransferase [Myxococcales bacterium]|nr:pyridoxal phosphate-dependent aminotransferase [Myxococcales bacterium]
MTVQFSSRLPWQGLTNRFTQLLGELRQRDVPLLDLVVSNPTRALPALYSASLLAPLSSPEALRYEPSPQGALDARLAIADYYHRRGLRIDPEHLVLCASTSEAYSWLFQLLCNPGDAVLFPEPSYPLLPFLGSLASVEIRPYPLRFDGRFHLSISALEHARSDRTCALLSVSPNNPTGSYLRQHEAEALLSFCSDHDLALIVDEVFSDYAFADPCPHEGPRLLSCAELPSSLAQIPALRFVLSGFSKVLGLPQLKLGWILVAGPEPLRTEAQARLELIADTFLSVGTPVQLATPALLRARDHLFSGISRRISDSLQVLQTQLAGSAVTLLPVEGGWYATLRLPRLVSEEEWLIRLLCEEHMIVHPGYFFDFPDEAYVVVSLLSAPADLAEGCRRLLAKVESL